MSEGVGVIIGGGWGRRGEKGERGYERQVSKYICTGVNSWWQVDGIVG